MELKPVCLQIWYSQDGKVRPFVQGKIYQDGKKWIYLADVDEKKLWHNYNGYSIAKQLTDAFSKLKLRVRICYRLKRQGLMYETNLSTITGAKSILINFGGHSQWVLPLKNWKVLKAIQDDIHGLPVTDLNKWSKPEASVIFHADGTYTQL